MYRCGEIAKEVYVKFEEDSAPWKKMLHKKQVISKFGQVAKQVVDKILSKRHMTHHLLTLW